jgi:hypothetical protein
MGGAPGEATIDALAETLLQQIVPVELLEQLANPAASPTDERALEDLPTVRIEPHVVLTISATEPTAVGEARERAAGAAERRRDEAAPEAPSDGDAAERPAGGSREFRATGSSFGTPLSDLPGGLRGEAVLAQPETGERELENAAECRGRIVLMWRGGCNFVEKVRRGQAAGALGVVVVQTGSVWPFSMSDTKMQAGDVTVPSLMVPPAVGDALRHAIGEARAAGGAAGAHAPRTGYLWATAVAMDHQTSCAVCLQELVASTLAVRLACGHTFHEPCVRLARFEPGIS